VSGYFDAATAEPLHPAARETLLAALDDGWADPDRAYRESRRARLLLDGAREAVAAALAVRPDEVTFTPSGTVANQLALLGGLLARRRTGRHLVVSAVEHSTVLAAARHHEDGGGAVTTVGVDSLGRVDPDEYAAALRADTALASLQSANHEVGTIQPVAQVAERCRDAGVALHVDAAQTAGRLPLPYRFDLLTASARKWGGPAGVGVLVVRTGTRWRSPLPEDEHEAGRAPGPVSLPLVLAAAAALQARQAGAEAEAARLSELTQTLRAQIRARVPDVEVLGPDAPDERLPHIVAFSCLYVAGEALMSGLDWAGFSVSSGSSCSSSALTPSHVLEAMGALTHGNVRVSLGADATAGDVDRFLDVLPGVVAGLRDREGVQGL
jgi:cysteine desulfurase